MNSLELIGREQELFVEDMTIFGEDIFDMVRGSSFLVIGGAGSIGQAVVKEIFKRDPRVLHVVDISENNLVELVRDIRSSIGYIDGDFRTFAIDAGGAIYDSFIRWYGRYDYILNLSALKHVRSEKDPFTLMRMVEVNIENTLKSIENAKSANSKKYFCVSTDKATNPVNMMGASKSIMEKFLMRESLNIDISTARFANVAFSDGSLLHGFNQRIQKRQPISAPKDIRRYFVTPKEAGELCLFSTILGENRDILFPKLSEKLHLITFADIAKRYLNNLGYEPYICESEEEARAFFRDRSNLNSKRWACYFFNSDTTGEKDFEEFYTDREILDMDRFRAIGAIKNSPIFDGERLDNFLYEIDRLKSSMGWSRDDLVSLFMETLPEFNHKDTGKFLDNRM
ncbi:MAG: UDP-N-acetylglucosamine 4,6-dehydratase [Epsilonproteobacteria bacterium]|jgi:FlaA1/EpsC-like NDP-sugar epimerase|nr:UDP-N-acetylglucosamine 4,6-dehydratase [Campylobacterota bacterium]